METKQKNSFLVKAPSWLSALLILVLATIVFYISDSILTPHTETGVISHIINDLFIAVGCFLIVRKNPKSIWYVPVICNALLILSSILEPNFWKSSMLYSILGGWALSLIVSLIGALYGQRLKKLH